VYTPVWQGVKIEKWKENLAALPLAGERMQWPGALMVIDDPAGLAQSGPAAPGRMWAGRPF